MRTPAPQLFQPPGPGPGAAVFHALRQAWGARPGEAAPTCGWVLPAWWRLLGRLDQVRCAGWTGHWRVPLEAGPCAPLALVLLAHETGGRVVVDLDPDEQGDRAAWWHEGGRLVRVADDLPALARWLGQGPDDCLAAAQGRATAARVLAMDELPPDPMTQRWRSWWPPGARPLGLETAGQGIDLDGAAWVRHPTRPWFAMG